MIFCIFLLFFFFSTFCLLLRLLGHRRNGRGQRSFGHHPDGRQLQQYRQGGHVGSQRLRFHRQVSAVSADGQHRRRGGGFLRRLFHCRLAAESRADVVGQFDHGHAGFAGSGHRNAHARSTLSQTLRPYQTSHFQDHDEEHYRPGHLPDDRHFHSSFCRYLTPQFIEKNLL